MNNGANETNNQTIPGVKVAMPDAKPVDASTNDAGAAVSVVKQANTQPVIVSTSKPQVVATATTVAPTVKATAKVVAPSASTTVQPKPVVVATPSVTPSMVGTVAPTATETVTETGKKKKEKKPKNKLARFFFFIIILLIGGIVGFWYYHQQQMALMNYKCTPVSTSGETKELDLDSTIVKDLYGKVATTIREDLGSVELNDELKIYLAYRQIATSDLYESNCNKFSTTSMEPFKCEVTASFVPKAFKADTLQVELKKLFGEDTNISNQNVQLGSTCIGGYQYIPERNEYVQGQCGSTGATLYRVEKELIGATSTESTIVLTEKVKYYGNDSLDLPNKLVSGTYKYTFRLDMNYNYIYISKELVS